MKNFNLPTRSGWLVAIKTRTGNKIEKVLSQKDYETKQDVETFIYFNYGITKENCEKWSICECSY